MSDKVNKMTVTHGENIINFLNSNGLFIYRLNNFQMIGFTIEDIENCNGIMLEEVKNEQY